MVVEWDTHPFAAPLSERITEDRIGMLRGWGTLGEPLLAGFPWQSLKARDPLGSGCGDWSPADRAGGAGVFWLLHLSLQSGPLRQSVIIYCFPLWSAWCQALEEINKQGTGKCWQLRITYQVSRNPPSNGLDSQSYFCCWRGKAQSRFGVRWGLGWVDTGPRSHSQ